MSLDSFCDGLDVGGLRRACTLPGVIGDGGREDGVEEVAVDRPGRLRYDDRSDGSEEVGVVGVRPRRRPKRC